MKVAELLELRRVNWRELEKLCDEMKKRRLVTGEKAVRFATLYRSACADLALADAYQLPPKTVQFLHKLVGRAHNQLYRAQELQARKWARILLFDVPQQIFKDWCVQFMFLLFWSGFIISAWLAYDEQNFPDYAETMLKPGQMAMLEQNFANPIGRRGNANQASFQMAGYYIRHNTGIGLKCFVGGLLIIPGLAITLFNSIFLGGCFGYMARPDVESGVNFFHFVTAHGPFELTAIVLSAGAGLRLGIGWVMTLGFTRERSLQRTAQETLPVMGAAMILFFLAAMIEGFLSPSVAPYWIKQLVAVLSSGLLLFYFIVLGFPRREEVAV